MDCKLILFLNDETINYSRSICTENIIFLTISGIAINYKHVHKMTKWLFHTLPELERVINIAFGWRPKFSFQRKKDANGFLSFQFIVLKNGEKLQKMQKIFFGAFIYALILASNTRKGLLLLERKWHLKFWTTFWVWR